MNQDLITIPQAEALKVFTTAGSIDPYLDRIRSEIDGFSADAGTKAGRDEIRSMAHAVVRMKTYLDGVGKGVADEIKAIPKKVDSTRKRVRDTLDAWAEEVRRPLTDWEIAETFRVAAHRAAIEALQDPPGETAAEISARLKHLWTMPERDWQEYAVLAEQTRLAQIDYLVALLAAAKKREAEADELHRLRDEAEERAAKDRAEAARRAEEQRLQAAAEAAAQAERKKAADELQRAERERAAAEARAAQAERDKEAAIEAERERVAADKAHQEALAAKRAADIQHRADIEAIAAEALMSTGIISLNEAAEAIAIIARGVVPNVTITY